MLGYNNFEEFITQLFKHIENEIIIKYFIPSMVIIDMVFSFLFHSTESIYFLIILYLVDFFTGVTKSIYYSTKIRNLKKNKQEIPEEYKEKQLRSKKFPRFLLTMFVALVLLSLVKFAGEYSIIFLPLYSIFYSVFVGQQLISIIENFYELKLIPTKIYKEITTKINELRKNDNYNTNKSGGG